MNHYKLIYREGKNMIERYYKAAYLDKGYLLDSYGHKNLILEKINDDRLTADMHRTRSGSTQIFRRDYGDRQFSNEENADVVLKHPDKQYYAEFIEGEWYWVNGCSECSGDRRDWMCYSTCEKHDVCATCGISRKMNKGSCWVGKNGWTCTSCKEAKEAIELAKALEEMGEYDEGDFWHKDELTCPFCGLEMDGYDAYKYSESDCDEIKCDRCKNTYEVTGHISVCYTTRRPSAR
jgi:hypothetical protein